MDPIVFLNGEFIKASDATISIFDGGFLHGAGLFETMRADHGHVFRLQPHLDRMINSATALGLPITLESLPTANDFDKLIAENELKTARLRMTVTVGSMHPSDVAADRPILTVCVTASSLPAYPPELFRHGMKVMITTYTQSTADPLIGHKTINYLPRLLALRKAREFNCGEAFWFTPQNYLAEGCISSVFVVKDNAIATPPLDTPVLPSVTRSAVLEIAEREGIEHHEKAININDLLGADEVFITNSSMQVVPVCSVEKTDIAEGKPGPMAARLRQLYIELVDQECKAQG
ncbi:MAG: aminotransferase class IV family protein [Phycisphaerales bacterium]|nr:aminotransferase class IV family protein [Phycisphaerales bacterium]